MKVIKRNDSEQDFCLDKIISAVKRANNSVVKEEQMNDASIQKVIATVQKKLDGYNSISVEDIQDFVEQALIRHNKAVIAKNYILYRNEKKNKKKFTETEEKVLALINGSTSLRGDNANKKIDDNPSVRDYIAGLVCKSVANKILPKRVIEMHNSGKGHFHDADYSPLQRLHNCDLIDAENMFKYTFQMGDTLIECNEDTPFETACNLLAQVNLQVSGRQYGGQTVSWSHLLPFIANSRRIIRQDILDEIKSYPWIVKWAVKLVNTDKVINKKVEEKLRKEIYKGVKTYQYQVLCHSSSNGQTPFVSNNLCLREAQTQQELDDFAMLIEEIFKRRIKGVKNSSGHYISPLFPKLLYWMCDGLNVKKDDPYFYLTELAAECEVKRTQPDINSEKECRRVKDGQIIPSMGCRSLLSPIWEEHTYYSTKEFYWVGKDKLKDPNRHEYPYGKFVGAKSFEELENRDYKTGYDEGEIMINFRGNTGWLMKKTDTEVTILEPKVYGRFNEGVFTINLPHVGLSAKKEYEESDKSADIMTIFYRILDERLEICREALKERDKSVRSIKAINSEILWMRGALARLDRNQTVGDLMDMYPKRASISLGYVGLFETCYALIGESNTTERGQKLSIEILEYMNKKCNEWKVEDHLNYSIYGTPEESLTLKFAMANRKDFGLIEHITDKDYVVNSYHVDPRETIDAFKKLEIEGKYLALSAGGAVSYVETLDLSKNKEAIIAIMQWMYEKILYAEFNRKIGVCYVCGHEGDIEMIKTENGKFKFKCPHCGNEDDDKMDVTARICGYLGKVNAGNVNAGRADDIYNRTVHLDCYEEME